MTARPIVVYDANVLYPAQLRDLLMRLAVAGLVRAHWSDQIHEEWMENVLANRPDLRREQLERTRALMERALPSARVEGCVLLVRGSPGPRCAGNAHAPSFTATTVEVP